ncbi:hypothetical protein CTAM01_01481 [Colletotrichum tamarilloi]|uniref:Uncharacterized protein n=1 Tax=Colletotrichum tamarilloi TaxID=1209934 RepID=A0ABQ9RR98_9PEZI|nr:uncharacterized protein CTAM01_01481 [Colletotrichum tamarilloi]KAK1510908.1 hypothetical protein CTAM01_01481 [Colletotrichum tamarilloi]
MLVLVGIWHLIWDLTTVPIKVPLERRTERVKESIQFATREWGVFAVYLTSRGVSQRGRQTRAAGGPGPALRHAPRLDGTKDVQCRPLVVPSLPCLLV